MGTSVPTSCEQFKNWPCKNSASARIDLANTTCSASLWFFSSKRNREVVNVSHIFPWWHPHILHSRAPEHENSTVKWVRYAEGRVQREGRFTMYCNASSNIHFLKIVIVVVVTITIIKANNYWLRTMCQAVIFHNSFNHQNNPMK